MRRLRHLIPMLLCAAGAAYGGAAPRAMVEPPQAHPSRIIVKYRSAVTDRTQRLTETGRSFAAGAAQDSLDRLGRRFGVRSARALFRDGRESGASAAAARAATDDARTRFPVRAARAPSGATVPDLSNVLVLDLAPGVDPEIAAKAFASDPHVEYAEPDYLMRATLVPDDPLLSDLWGLQAIDAPLAWDVATGSGMIVAIVDTGVKTSHRDLLANVWTNPGEIPRNRIDDDGNGFVDDVYGWDFVKNRNRPLDRNGHGTHVAGTVAATGNNGLGVAGVAWGTRVMAVRGLDARGEGYSSDLAEAIEYAARNGADVINNSWGGPDSGTVRLAVDAARSLGAVVVFAAGNEGTNYFGQATDPDVIAVAATQAGDLRASFSNYGSNISVAAPGVDILSLRGPGSVGGQTVERQYRRLSGTSMAAPHVAGTVALLLSALPGLTIDEVRWHLELSATQPGWPGYEGPPWNPYFGWGRIDAGRVFDTPPVTTRVRTKPFVLHGYAGASAAGVASLDFSFTTLDPIAWTLSGAPWLTPAVASGNGPAVVSLALDGTAIAPGSYDGSIVVDAPAAVDGGASVAATAHLHQDHRVGSPIEVTPSFEGFGAGFQVAHDGQGVLVLWVDRSNGPDVLRGAYVDDAGVVTGPFAVEASGCVDAHCYQKGSTKLAAAFDGTSFLVVWQEEIELHANTQLLKHIRHDYVKAVRVTRTGEVLGTPVVVAENAEPEDAIGSYDQFFYNLDVGFDGTASSVLWGRLDFGTTYANATRIYLRRVGTTGDLLGPTSQIYPASDTGYPQYVQPKIACVTGSCLVGWHEADGEVQAGKYIDKLYGKRFDGVTPLDAAAVRLLRDVEGVNALESDGTGGYLAVGHRATACGGPSYWCYDLIGARIAAGGASLDPDGFRLNNSAPLGFEYSIAASAVAFDGASYVVTWGETSASPSYPRCYLFAARVGTDGTVVDSEPEGLLLAPTASYSCNDPQIAPTASKSLAVYVEYVGGIQGAPDRIVAQGVLPR